MKREIHSNFFQRTLVLILSCIALSAVAQVPSDLMRNCNQWKITYPTGSEDKTLCNEPNNEYFKVNTQGDAIVFFAPIRSNNGTTPNSSYIRSELREREANGSSDIYWTTEGKHFLYVKQAITHLPINKAHLVASQIHGNKDDGIDDAMVLRLEENHLFLSFNGGVLRSDVTIKTNYTLGTVHEVIFVVDNGKHYCYYAEDDNLLSAYNKDSASSYLVRDGSNDYVMDKDYVDSYFKVGNYTQSNADKEGIDTDDPDNYGEVLVYDFKVEHTIGDVSGVELSPGSIDLGLGNNLQLTAAVSPSGAANSSVSFTSSDTSVVTVSESGLVRGKSVGEATVTVTTDQGDYTATSFIRVVPPAIGLNLALNKTSEGTGTHDGENEVANLVDGQADTRWSVSGYPQFAMIDLGAVYTLSRTEVVCYKDRAYQYTISVAKSEDGAYTEIVDRSENTTISMNSNPLVDLFSGIEGRFVKIEVTGADVYKGSWVSLAELRVFGEQTAGYTKILKERNEVNLWPNPVIDKLRVNAAVEFKTIEIYNMKGVLVTKQSLSSRNSIDVSSLSSGIYVARITGDRGTKRIRFIKG